MTNLSDKSLDLSQCL